MKGVNVHVRFYLNVVCALETKWQKCPKDHFFFPSNIYEFQWKLVHFYKVWRSCPASMDFCVKGSCCCVPSVGWNKCTAAWLQWLTSALFLIIAVLHCWPHYPPPPPMHVSCVPLKLARIFISRLSPSAFLASFASLFGCMPSGTSFQAFLVYSSSEGCFL